jgi:hypothetical protein
LPPAPPRFSITTGWPSASASGGWITRATMSLAPPGANGTTSVTGRSGQAAAPACGNAAASASSSAAM